MVLLLPLTFSAWVDPIYQIDADVELDFGCRVFVCFSMYTSSSSETVQLYIQQIRRYLEQFLMLGRTHLALIERCSDPT